jgi:hypothetical protein
VIWLLANMELLEDGRWPPKSKGYEGTPKVQGGKGHAEGRFVTPILVHAELTRRLDACYIPHRKYTESDGDMLEQIYRRGKSFEDLARTYHTTPGKINSKVRSAFLYIEGEDMKRETYEEWKKRTGRLE